MTDTVRSLWFDLPVGARDWVNGVGRYAHRIEFPLTSRDWLLGRERLAEWDALAGRMLRSVLFDDVQDPRATRKLAEAVAAVAESLAVALGEQRH